MRSAAETILGGYSKFTSEDDTAENTGLVSNSVDCIICAQAFHWFDRDKCKREFQRILKSGGKVVLVWNKRRVEDRGFSTEYEDLLRTYANDYSDINHNLITDTTFGTFFKYGVFNKVSFENEQQFDFEGLKGRLLASSYAPVPGELNYEPLIMELKKLVDIYKILGKVTFKYNTEVYIGEV